jgi:hypothetical protein
MNDIATSQDTARAVGRPLAVLVPLIKKDFALGQDAAEEAAMPYYKAAGEKLIEARSQQSASDFWLWVKHHFGRSESQCKLYMKLAQATISGKLGSAAPGSLNAFQRDHLGRQRPTHVYPQPWHEPIKETLSRVNVERHEQTPAKKSDERALQRALAIQLIDIGFKALSTKLHPDRGGSKEAMQRLNAVKMKLKIAVEKL